VEGDILYGWAPALASVGTAVQPVSARPGLALDRSPIPPPDLAGEDFKIGENLEIRGNSLVAICSGLLRYNDNWADLVPCRRQEWNLDGGPGEGGCFLDYTPGHPAVTPVSPAEIVRASGKIGFLPEKIISESEIRSILTSVISEGRSLSGYPISRDTDGLISIKYDPLRTRAELVLRRETGSGRPMVLNSIGEEIRNSGLRGLDGPAVKAAIMKFWNSGSGTTVILLKEGTLPERGPDRELEFQIPFLEEDKANPVRDRLVNEPQRSMGIASLRDFPPEAVNRMALVEKGQVIGRLGSPKAGKAGKDVDGRPLPGFPGNDPDIRTHEDLNWNGDSIVAAAPGILDVGRTAEGLTRMRIRPHQDAAVQISVSADKIKAFVSTRLPAGTGAPVDLERLRDSAEKAGVVKGLSEEAMQEVVDRSLTGEIITGQVIAEGRLPMEGDTRLSLSVTGDPARSPVPVKSGDIIGVLKGGDSGGWNVLGEPLMDEGGVLKIGENILRRENDDGNTVLIAERGGHLVMSDGSLLVRHLLDYVGDISLASGNVRYPGRIKIQGSVLSRVVVDAGEGVEVSEVVQAALVNSGGDIVIGKGVKGEGKAVLRSQGNLVLGYAEDANLLSSGNIRVSRTLMNCRVKCNGRLEFAGNEGKLIGGIMKLKEGLTCTNAGNERGSETVISFGQDYLVENQIETVQKEQQKIQEFISKIDQMMADLEKTGAVSKLIQLRQKKVDAMKMLEKKNKLIFLLREKFELHFDSEIRITGTAWPGVVFESHGRLMKVAEPLKSVSITFNREKGRLEKKPLR
jgi:hypothetical protein